MNIEQIIKNYEEYKEGLDQALHKLDNYKQKCNEEFLLSKAEMLKSPEKIQEGSGQSIDEWEKDFEELRSSFLFPITCVLPLQTIIAHYLAKNSIPSLNEEVDLIIKTKNPSVRDIYRIFKQLPENVTVSIFNNIGIGFIIDAFRDGEDCFYVKFESLENKSEILDELYFIAKTFELGSNVEQLFDINDENTLEAVKFYIQEYKDSVKAHPEYKNTNAFCEAFDPNQFVQMDHKTSRISVDLNGSMNYYKQLLIKYIELSPRFDSYTKKCIDKVLQSPDYIDITNELLAECKEELKQESINNEEHNIPENNELKPFPFPYNNIKIEEEQTKTFLEKLYEKLLNSEGKQYLEKGQKELFVYLFGGSEEKPNTCVPLVWLRQKNELQAFLLAFMGENAGEDTGWATFNNYFWWKKENQAPKLANSSGRNINSDIKDKFVKIMNGIKKEFVSNAS